MTDTAQAPNPADFSKNEKPKDYTARVTVRGTISISIQADSPEDAKRQAEAEVERMEKEGYVEIDDIDEIELYRVYKDQPMFRVTRDGKPMQEIIALHYLEIKRLRAALTYIEQSLRLAGRTSKPVQAAWMKAAQALKE